MMMLMLMLMHLPKRFRTRVSSFGILLQLDRNMETMESWNFEFSPT